MSALMKKTDPLILSVCISKKLNWPKLLKEQFCTIKKNQSLHLIMIILYVSNPQG